MEGLNLFYILILFVIFQRIVELFIAKRNEQILLSQGAYEVGKSHYPYMIAMHVSFFISLIMEVILFDRSISRIFPLLLFFFLLVQVLRVWCIVSLGKFWNTKIIILPGANVLKKGPYLFMRHPNYFVVSLEFLLIPFMFQAYFTAFTFTFLNIVMLSIRIPLEEKALMANTNYKEKFKMKIQAK